MSGYNQSPGSQDAAVASDIPTVLAHDIMTLEVRIKNRPCPLLKCLFFLKYRLSDTGGCLLFLCYMQRKAFEGYEAGWLRP